MDSERLRQLNNFLPTAQAHAEECRAAAEDAEALVRQTKAAIAKETRERRHLRGLPLLFPAALAAAGAVGRWAGRNSAGVAAFGAGATVAAVAAVGVGQLGGDPPTGRQVVTAPTPPATSLPPAGHTPSPTHPPKGSPSAPPPPSVMPTPTPGQPSPGTPLPDDTAVPPSHTPPGKPSKAPKPPKTKPPHTPAGKPPRDDADPEGVKEECRINLLGTGILCGHLFSSGRLPVDWPLS
jgi:hypothetical protein